MRFAAGLVAAIGAALLLAVLQDALQLLHPDHTRMLSLALGAIGLVCLCGGMLVCYLVEKAQTSSVRVAPAAGQGSR